MLDVLAPGRDGPLPHDHAVTLPIVRAKLG